MEGVPLSLVVVVVALTCGGGPVHSLARDCDMGDFTLKHGDKQLIKENHGGGNFIFLDMYMKPQPGFQGLFVTVTGLDGMPYGAWFPADPQCFLLDDKWYFLFVLAETKANNLHLAFWIGDCYKECIINYSQGSVRVLAVEAYGPSIWLLKGNLNSCDAGITNVNMVSRLNTPPTCDSAPPQAPTTPPTTTTTTPPITTTTPATTTTTPPITSTTPATTTTTPATTTTTPPITSTPATTTTTPPIITTPPITTTQANGTGQSCACKTASSAGPTWKMMVVMAATVAVVVVV